MSIPANAKTTTMMAIFKGSDGSIGYRRGSKYDLVMWINPQGSICIFCPFNNKGYCIYTSLFSFLENWIVLPNINQ